MAKKLKLKVNPKKLKKNDKGLNLFELGTLIQFETHSWQGRKQLPKEITARITPNSQTELVRANKNLIHSSHLLEINRIISNARNYVTDMSNPFPIKGIHFINNNIIDQVKETLDMFTEELNDAVDKFVKKYEDFVAEAELELMADDLFNESEYPNPDKIKDRFSISYRFFDLTIPSHIKEDMKKEEMEKFQKLMKETKEMGMLALREGFAEIVTHLTDTLTGKLDGERKRLSEGAIEKFGDFFKSFQHKNMFQDKELEGIIENAMEILDGVNYKNLKKDKELQELVNENLLEVKEELNKSISSYKRKLSFK